MHGILAQLRGQFAVLCGKAGRLRSSLQWQRLRGKSLQFRAIDVGGQRKQPGRKTRLPPPVGQPAPGAQKSILGHLLRTAAIAAVAPGHVDQRPLPAADDPLEGLHVAIQHARNVRKVGVGPVVLGAGCGVHSGGCASATGRTGSLPLWLHFLADCSFLKLCNRMRGSPVLPSAWGISPARRKRWKMY